MLQITQSPDGQLLGSFEHFGLKPDGTIEQVNINVSGTTDGKSLTVVLNSSINVSGSVDGNNIVLNVHNSTERFVPSTADVYQAAVRDLTEQSQIVEGNKKATGLTNDLRAYVVRVQNLHGLQPLRDERAKILDEARRDLEAVNRLKTGDNMQQIQANVLRTNINVLSTQIFSSNYYLDQEIQKGHEHVQQFDDRIAQSPCNSDVGAKIHACREEKAEVQVYEVSRARLLQLETDADAFAKQSTAELDTIKKEAGN